MIFQMKKRGCKPFRRLSKPKCLKTKWKPYCPVIYNLLRLFCFVG